jgi:hypothetical protein
MVMPMTLEPGAPADFLLPDFLALETPEGYRAELINGEIVVTSPPDGNHEDITSTLVAQVLRSSATAMDFSGVKGLVLPIVAGSAGNHVIPDTTFAPREERLFRGAAPWMEPHGVAMVSEVTSSRPGLRRQDRSARAVRLHARHLRVPRVIIRFWRPRGR